MFNIAVCDDETADRERIVELAYRICQAENIACAISAFESAKELFKTLQEDGQFDLLLLDVMMPEQNGMELARRLLGREDKTSIVFISNNREMALQGYEVCARRYLAKPVDEEHLKEAILFCYKSFQSSRGLLLPFDDGVRKVDPKEIWYIEISGRKCRVVQEKETWMTTLSIRKLEEMLAGQNFIRCHQSFLVNCAHIRVFHGASIELSDGKMLPVSKHRLREARQVFFNYMEG